MYILRSVKMVGLIMVIYTKKHMLISIIAGRGTAIGHKSAGLVTNNNFPFCQSYQMDFSAAAGYNRNSFI